MILCTQSYVGQHGGCRHQGQGGVHQKVNIKLLGMCTSLIHFLAFFVSTVKKIFSFKISF